MGKCWDCVLATVSLSELTALLLCSTQALSPLPLVLLPCLGLSLFGYYLLAFYHCFLHATSSNYLTRSLALLTLWSLYLLCVLFKLDPYRLRSLFQPIPPRSLYSCMLLFHLFTLCLPCLSVLMYTALARHTQPQGLELATVVALGGAAVGYGVTLMDGGKEV